jgi:multimeric flavodoxin WrbA
MKILGLSSGSKNGNNDAMCKEALMGAQEVGAEIEFIHLLDLNLKYCTGCITCVMSIFGGKGNRCALKDDFEWLLDKMLDADGIVFTTPIFVKGVPGIIHTIRDRFGPRMDRAHNIIAAKIAEEGGGKAIDPRIISDKVISFMGIGGSDWTTRVQCDHGLVALSPMWKIIDNETFQWSKCIVVEDEKVARARRIGVNLAEAARDIAAAQYKGEAGICPHCHSRNFYLNDRASEAVCCLCGIVGEITVVDGRIAFHFPESQVAHAHDTIPGKFKHAEDIKENEGRTMETKKTNEYKTRMKTYKDFISPSLPDH